VVRLNEEMRRRGSSGATPYCLGERAQGCKSWRGPGEEWPQDFCARAGTGSRGSRSENARRTRDELALMVHPIVLGSGMRLFDEMTHQVRLKLVESRTLSTGVLSVTYQPASA